MSNTQTKISYSLKFSENGSYLYTGFDAGSKVLKEYERLSALHPEREYKIDEIREVTVTTETTNTISSEELKRRLSWK